MAWLRLPRIAARHLALDLWGTLHLDTAEDGTAAVVSSNLPLPGTCFLYSFIRFGTWAHTLSLTCNSSPTIQVNIRHVKVYPVRARKLLTLRNSACAICALCNCPLENPKTLDSMESELNSCSSLEGEDLTLLWSVFNCPEEYTYSSSHGRTTLQGIHRDFPTGHMEWERLYEWLLKQWMMSVNGAAMTRLSGCQASLPFHSSSM